LNSGVVFVLTHRIIASKFEMFFASVHFLNSRKDWTKGAIRSFADCFAFIENKVNLYFGCSILKAKKTNFPRSVEVYLTRLLVKVRNLRILGSIKVITSSSINATIFYFALVARIVFINLFPLLPS
jgi:hypothetical protein